MTLTDQTLLEAAELVAAHPGPCQIDCPLSFVVAHAQGEALYTSRDRQGLTAALFGWPITEETYEADYDGEWVEEAQGTMFFVNYLVCREPMKPGDLLERIQERHPQIEYLVWQRSKHEDRWSHCAARALHGK